MKHLKNLGKLVRDKLVDVIPADELRRADSREIIVLTASKVDEELDELKASGFSDVLEYADVFEALFKMASLKGISREQIEAARLKKLAEKGGFDTGLVWKPSGQVAENSHSEIPRPNEPGTVFLWTDGGCSGNPGPGGWAAVITRHEGELTTCADGLPWTTNNQMELSAAIKGFSLAIEQDASKIVAEIDSKYVIDGMQNWLPGWKRNGWKTSAGKDVKNIELWQKLDAVLSDLKSRNVVLDIRWVRGHNGNPGNELADSLATAMVDNFR